MHPALVIAAIAGGTALTYGAGFAIGGAGAMSRDPG
jgi:hypothetical protein